MANLRCGNCRHLDRASATDIGGLPIAICAHPKGARVDTSDSLNDYVAFDYVCASHISRFKATEQCIGQSNEEVSGGAHA